MAEPISYPEDWVQGHVVWQSENLRLEYSGPKQTGHTVVAFPPYDYPFDAAEGWGSRSFTKRGIAHVCVFHARPDWHQYDDFFEAMAACRAFLGRRHPVVSYGFSMGGYGALLGAQALRAKRAVAVSPQVSIDPAAVRFERRYHAEWAAMGKWKHQLRHHMDKRREYVVIYDPLHGQDRKHEARIPRCGHYSRVIMHGVGHAAIQSCVQMGIQEVLFDLLRDKTDPKALRCAFRSKRRLAFAICVNLALSCMIGKIRALSYFCGCTGKRVWSSG